MGALKSRPTERPTYVKYRFLEGGYGGFWRGNTPKLCQNSFSQISADIKTKKKTIALAKAVQKMVFKESIWEGYRCLNQLTTYFDYSNCFAFVSLDCSACFAVLALKSIWLDLTCHEYVKPFVSQISTDISDDRWPKSLGISRLVIIIICHHSSVHAHDKCTSDQTMKFRRIFSKLSLSPLFWALFVFYERYCPWLK